MDIYSVVSHKIDKIEVIWLFLVFFYLIISIKH